MNRYLFREREQIQLEVPLTFHGGTVYPERFLYPCLGYRILGNNEEVHRSTPYALRTSIPRT